MKTDFQTLKTRVNNGIITILLNRPQVHNAFNSTMLLELIGLLDEIKEEKEIRVAVFTGQGKSFSAGADLNWMREIINYSYEENLRDSERISELFYKIYTLNKPVISAINGAAIGGGMGFVAASDIVISSEKAVFSLSEVKIGVVPACISPYLIRKSGEGALKEFFLTGKKFYPEEALRINLINYVVKHEELLTFAETKARELLLNGPRAMAVCKELFREIPEMHLEKAYNHTTEVIARLRTSEEAQEGMKAFLEKRDPGWRRSPSGD